ncbi:MAG: response regulator [Okeania sp. SIO3C4]|nr:response regulator [Okeania sp. SIO3C4]
MSLELTTISSSYILIVDDMPINLRLLSILLQRNGYQVKTELSGKTALETIRTNPPSLILLDVMMPEMDGYEVCQQLKTLDELCDIPVIFISALDDTLDKIKAFELGAVDYITKPFQSEEVLARVKNQLIISSLQAQLHEKNQELTEQNLQLQAEIAEKERAETEIRFLLETTQSINNADDFNSALAIILQSCCQLINWDFSEAWIPNQVTNVLEYSQVWYAREPHLDRFGTHSSKLTFSYNNNSLPGNIWASQKPQWIEDFSTKSKVAAEVGLKSAFGLLADS